MISHYTPGRTRSRRILNKCVQSFPFQASSTDETGALGVLWGCTWERLWDPFGAIYVYKCLSIHTHMNTSGRTRSRRILNKCVQPFPYQASSADETGSFIRPKPVTQRTPPSNAGTKTPRCGCASGRTTAPKRITAPQNDATVQGARVHRQEWYTETSSVRLQRLRSHSLHRALSRCSKPTTGRSGEALL